MSDSHDIVRAESVPVSNAPALLHPAVERMLALSPTPETLREILALQREWQRDVAKQSYTRALVELKRDLPAWIKRDKVVDYQGGKGRVRYTHSSLAAVMDSVLPAITAHGFSLSFPPAILPNGHVSVTATLTHRDGHSEVATLSAPPDASGLKSAPQAVASTVTLLQRYTALAILGVATSDMDEPKTNGSAEAEQQVDSARNLRAMADIAQAGKTRAEAEGFIGKPLPAWTPSDLAKLRAWIAPAPPAAQVEQAKEEPSTPEPGADVNEDNADALLPTDRDQTPISESDQRQLFVLLAGSGKNQEVFKAYLAKEYQLASTKEIPQMLYGEIATWCQQKPGPREGKK